jgi:CRISPR/Cas system CSM-associated protein Csm2 small subunit
MKKEQPLIKIWDKRNTQYISGNGKTHWRSMKWIESKLRDLCGDKRSWGGNRNIDDFEIQTFELQLVETQPARIIYEESEHKRKNQIMNKEIADRCKAKILKLFPNIAVQQTRALYRDGLLNSESMEILKPIMDQLVEAERNS